MKFNFNNRWFTRIFSFVLAIGLFFFVNLENQTRFQSTAPTDGASITSTEIITNLPIEVNINTDQYFVSGIPDSATLRLEGPQALIFQTVATQSYTVSTPNLNALGSGEHTVQLQVEGVSESITTSVSPGFINLTIEEKETGEYELSAVVDEELDVAEGYELLEPSLSTNIVQLSGAASTMAKIDQVVVEIASSEEGINSDLLMSAQVLVLDENGEPLNVNTNPSQVEINVPVVRTIKEVPIVLREGTNGQVGYNYEVSLSNAESDTVQVRGEPEAIAALQNFPVTVDLSGITESQVITIPIQELPPGIEEISKEEIEIVIDVTEENNNSRIDF